MAMATQRAATEHDEVRPRESGERPIGFTLPFGGLLGRSLAMRTAITALERAAPTCAPILLLGESGTGKELAARAVHAASPRAERPFEVVDCGGLPPTLIESELFGHERGSFTGADRDRPGAFERADGGTLFLGELPLELQPKLLRALGERQIRRLGGERTKQIDVRIVAATNRDLQREVNESRFRADLFYRLAVIRVRMPPLRERLDDIPLLARGLLRAMSPELEAPLDLPLDMPALMAHTWPGNVRELGNYLQQLVILKSPPALTPEDDSLERLRELPLHAALDRFERAYLASCLASSGNNVAEAARRAGVNRATMYRCLSRHALKSGVDSD
jgi:two-component system response regulator GlrR